MADARYIGPAAMAMEFWWGRIVLGSEFDRVDLSIRTHQPYAASTHSSHSQHNWELPKTKTSAILEL